MESMKLNLEKRQAHFHGLIGNCGDSWVYLPHFLISIHAKAAFFVTKTLVGLFFGMKGIVSIEFAIVYEKNNT
jgi:hypothetical protein